MSRRMWKAISPLIATVILIAVTIAIAAIVIAWVYGIIGPTTATPEKLQIYPDARLINMTAQVIFNVTVKNAGGVSISLSKIYIREAPSCSTSNIQTPFIVNNAPISSLSPGSVGVLNVSFSGCSVSPGATYTVVIVTQSGQAYYVTVTAEQGS
jgi:flagellin-like protein